jgi:molybdopterin synthase sulfur carrier subunit
MTQVVTIPRHLANVANTGLQILVSAGTAGAAIDELLSRHPELRVHLFEESGVLRPHVICFIDGEPSRLRNPDCEVQREITFLHAVSGGSS